MVSCFQRNLGLTYWKRVLGVIEIKDFMLCYHGGDIHVKGFSDRDRTSDKSRKSLGLSRF